MKRPVKRERESGPVKLPTIAAYLMFVNAINSSKIYAHETDSQDYSCFQISLKSHSKGYIRPSIIIISKLHVHFCQLSFRYLSR